MIKYSLTISVLLKWCVCFSILLSLNACKQDKFPLPKPRMYPKVEWPERNTVIFDTTGCPFTFDYPDYFEYSRDISFFDEPVTDLCWFNLHTSSLNSTLHFSYYPIRSSDDFDKYINDAFQMAGEHNIKASSRKESLIESPGLSGLIFEIDGPVASPLQFYMTDSTRHFLRASLYFDAKVNPDSTSVVFDFLKQDINMLIESFHWK